MQSCPYKLIRRFRKTVLIRITDEAEVEVFAPKKLDVRAIDEFVAEKRDWIEQKLKSAREVLEKRRLYRMQTLDFLGKEYPVKIYDGPSVLFDGDCFLLPDVEESEKRALAKAWYKKQARELLARRAVLFAEKMGCTYASLKVTSARKRWGSYTAKNNLNFSWRLILAPGDAIDYVVIHELAHAKFKKHDRAFYDFVSSYCENYKEREKILRQLGAKLSVQNW